MHTTGTVLVGLIMLISVSLFAAAAAKDDWGGETGPRRMVLPSLLGMIVFLGVAVWGAFKLATGDTVGFDGWDYAGALLRAFAFFIGMAVKGYLAPIVAGVVLSYSVYMAFTAGTFETLPFLKTFVSWALGLTSHWIGTAYAIVWLVYSIGATVDSVVEFDFG